MPFPCTQLKLPMSIRPYQAQCPHRSSGSRLKLRYMRSPCELVKYHNIATAASCLQDGAQVTAHHVGLFVSVSWLRDQ